MASKEYGSTRAFSVGLFQEVSGPVTLLKSTK